MKPIKSTQLFLIFFCVFSIKLNAQHSLSFSTGFAADLNNADKNFSFIPVMVQWMPFSKKDHLFLQVNYDICFANNKGSGYAYTLTPDMPPAVLLPEKIKVNLLTIGIGTNIRLKTFKQGNQIFLPLIPVGFCFQNFKVDYKNYDNKNYEVLNPDVSKKIIGPVFSFGLGYYFNHNSMIQLILQTPLLKAGISSSYSYKSAAPLRLTFGYKFYYKEKDK